jgi:putative nucleotidyltransferase with HDIG domain
MAPPVRTIRQLDIQGYYEKDDRFDQLELLVESCVKSIKQLRTIREYQNDMSRAYMQTIDTLRIVVESRDKETEGHSERVSRLGTAIATELGLPPDEIEMVKLAGLFHDIGKIGVPDSILLKNGPLTNEEFEQIKKHPAEGEKILSTYTPFACLLPIVRNHHERFNGRGYPDGIAGDDIPIGARVVAVADSFDAMISNRTYRKGLGFDKAVDELIKGRGGQFDERAVNAMLRLVDRLGREEFEKLYCSHNSDNGEEK